MTTISSTTAVSVQRQTISSRIALTVALLIILVIPTMPWWASGGHIRWLVELSCMIAIAQMWNLLAGYAGLVSVGQQAFIGAGGYALFVLATKLGVNPFLAVPLSVVAPVALAIPSYFLLRRLDGSYFAIGTWVLAELFRLLTANIPYLNSGAGMSLSVMARYSQDQRQIALASFCAVLLFITVGGVYWLLRSRHGLALTAMRDDPVAAESQGVNVKRLRFVVFVLAAAGSGLAGAVYYMAQLRINPESGFDSNWSSICIFAVMVGGIGRIEGAIVGVLLYFFATRLFGQYGASYLVVLGLLTVFVALFAPGGLWSLLLKVRNWPWFPVSRRLIGEPPQREGGLRMAGETR
ncbi:branched-chain amino acid ABC transporter permease [Bradyrhizobium diazoefficiens]|uniref:branched-chain amino acid ABC transporter permease n=1 Tax=Bradyrhizobium diazoefficiens TaxID=1355477 RepID=UPI001B8CEF6C|nr:branched-chain amino acid ABC transporter permease [Bradyrhizobium diazoefficiens]MBR0863516.1 branched-chain amino acid ABC transporter permease [Bradyrhizobium diazoefficiens]MBR0888201.1 branched-chain amino acid ABC transporter permease [Bradyrhizobium diazoefficiens]MBR0919842.1 branched-chain amino acid ABC transporter permease [Bradyrhizobium diazoefficiens]